SMGRLQELRVGLSRHPRASGDPATSGVMGSHWIPAFAGMTAWFSGGPGHDDLQALEVVAEKTGVAGDQAPALQQGVGADDEVRHGTRPGRGGGALGAAALVEAALH